MRHKLKGQVNGGERHIDPLVEVSKNCGPGIIAVGLASAIVNILYLTAPFFMLQVYDRVIPGKSVPSLVVLGVLALMLYSFQAVFEIIRNRILVRMGGVFDEVLAPTIFDTTVRAGLKLRLSGDGVQLLRDFDQIRSFLGGSGPAIVFDLPWIPLYVVVCFLFHPVIGWMTIGGGMLLVVLTTVANRTSQKQARAIHDLSVGRTADMQSAQRNAEIVTALGMTGALSDRWIVQNNRYRAVHRGNSDVANSYAAISKIFRAILQSAVLAAGAVLVIENEASAGIIIASSILTSRALAPVEQVVANARSYAATLQAWRRMKELLAAFPGSGGSTRLPRPSRSLIVENLASGAPGQQRPSILGVNFEVRAGSAVGVVGPSASGKSSLARALTNVWPIYRGSVRLDGATLDRWQETELGSYVGYLPQDIELFSGTIAENISRFLPAPSAAAIIAAAITAGVHDLILRLPDAYETEIGPGGSMLSAGQRQRIGLARALFNNPFLVVLDEPNSNLDAEGEAAVTNAILSVRKRGGIVVVIAHRPSALAGVDLVLMIKDGQMQAFGKKEDVLQSILAKQVRPVTLERPTALKIVDSAEG